VPYASWTLSLLATDYVSISTRGQLESAVRGRGRIRLLARCYTNAVPPSIVAVPGMKAVMPDNKTAWAAATYRIVALIGLSLACCGPLALAADRAVPPYDLIIEHGRIVDGTGAPWIAADIGIRAGRIAAIGRLDKVAAKQRIDAAGRVVAPGFIDMLGQSELTLLVNPHVPSKIFQGITTEITGEGESVAPVNAAIAREAAPKFQPLRN
jgi:hypothetical protein